MHFLFDFFEIFRSKRLLAQELVEKSGVDRRADAELHVGIQLHHRGGKKMRGGVAKNVKRVRIFFGEDLQFDVVIERAPQIDQFAGAIIGLGYARHQRGIRQARRDFPRDIRGCRALWHFLNFAVRQSNVNRIHAEVHLRAKQAYRRDTGRSRRAVRPNQRLN